MKPWLTHETEQQQPNVAEKQTAPFSGTVKFRLLVIAVMGLLPTAPVDARHINGTRGVAVAVTPDSSRAVVLGGAGQDSVLFFDTSSYTPVLIGLDNLSTGPSDVNITADGRFAVVRSGAAPDGIAIYRTSNGVPVLKLTTTTGSGGPTLTINSVEITPDGSRAVVLGGAGSTQSVQFFDTSVNPPVPLLFDSLLSAPSDVAVTPDSRLAVVRGGAAPDSITVYRTDIGARVLTVPRATAGGRDITNCAGHVHCIAITPDSSRAVVLGGAGADSVTFIDTSSTTNPTVIAIDSLSCAPMDVDITSDGRFAVIRAGACPEGIVVYRTDIGAKVSLLNTSTGGSWRSHVDSIRTTPDGSRAVVIGGAGNHSVVFFDTTTNLPAVVGLDVLSTAPRDVDVTSDNRFAVVRSGAAPGGIAFYSLANALPVLKYTTTTGNGTAIELIAVANNSSRVVVLGGAGATESVAIFDTSGSVPLPVAIYGLPTKPCDVEITPDNRLAIVRAGAGVQGVMIYRLDTGVPVLAWTTATGFFGCLDCQPWIYIPPPGKPPTTNDPPSTNIFVPNYLFISTTRRGAVYELEQTSELDPPGTDWTNALPPQAGTGDPRLLDTEMLQLSLTSQGFFRIKVSEPQPSIVVPPQSRTNYEGDSAMFSVMATGIGPLSFQWFSNGIPLLGAVSSQVELLALSLQSVQPITLRYVVTDGDVAVGGSAEVWVIPKPPSITTQPQNQAVNQSSNVTLTVVATGTEPLSYQWQRDGTNISGATSSSYSITNAQTTDAGVYRVIVSNSAGSVTSSNATLSVIVPPSIVTQPQSQTVNQTSNATLTVVATGTGPLSYQWQRDGTNISGATSSSYSITDVEPADAGVYRVIVSNPAGSVTSSNATLSVWPYFSLFSDDFDSDTFGQWFVNVSSTFNTHITFNYDYSALGIPPAPNSVGTTRGVRFDANMSGGFAAALSMSPIGQSFTGDYRLRFNMWLNANGPFPAGGAGATQFFVAGVGTTGDRVEWTGTNSSANGVYFSVDAEGGVSDSSTTSGDVVAYTSTTALSVSSGAYAAGTGTTARGNGNSYYTATFLGQAAPALQQSTYPQQTGTLANGTVGFKWRDVLIEKTGSTVKWYIDGLLIATVSNATLSGNNIFVGYWDAFASVSDNPALTFGLVDNVLVEKPAGGP